MQFLPLRQTIERVRELTSGWKNEAGAALHSKTSKDKILLDNRIVAQDQNKVFVESANGARRSPRDAEAWYRLKRGKGNAYVEFDVSDDEEECQINSLTGATEYFLRGDVDLTDRNPEGFDNT